MKEAKGNDFNFNLESFDLNRKNVGIFYNEQKRTNQAITTFLISVSKFSKNRLTLPSLCSVS